VVFRKLTALPGKLWVGVFGDVIVAFILFMFAVLPGVWHVAQVNSPYCPAGTPQLPPHFVDPMLTELCVSGLTGATVVFTTTLAGDAWPVTVRLTVVSLKLPFAAVFSELTVRLLVAVTPGARAKGVVSKVEGLNEPSGVSVSLNASVKVLLPHGPVSAFFTFTW